MNPQPSFEFCAFRFFTQWQEDESALHRALSTDPTEDDIRKALNYFQVARTFKGLKEPRNATFILRSLTEVRQDTALSTAEAKVNALVQKLEGRFRKSNVSASSKLLWLSEREPFIVYDSRAVKALHRDFNQRFTQCNYGEYADAWRNEYTKRESLIKVAIEKLPCARPFMRFEPPSDDEILSMAKEKWFLERVFDIFLWEVGAETIRAQSVR